MKNKGEHQEQVDLMRTIPVPKVEYEVTESNLVVLFVPRYRSKVAKKLLAPISRGDFVRVDLDEIGSRAWQLFDGKRTVAEISTLLQADGPMEQADDRLKLFIRALSARGYVDLFIVDHQEG